MSFSANEIATYQFCAQLPKTKTNPLTIIEWNVVVKSLSEQALEPKVLQTITEDQLDMLLTKATPAQKTKIIQKIDQRQQLAFSLLELEELSLQGYGIMFRSHMPKRIKKLTQKYLPAFFYYVGDVTLFTYRALGFVGARQANEEELAQTAMIARNAANQGVVVVSGGAKGVDETAVEAALKEGGKAIVFPADGLAKWVKKTVIREYIQNGQLLLLSTQRLEAPFSGHYAMLRNKYIHAIPDSVLVASSEISGTKTSGTWEGVLDNLKMKWTPLFVIGESEGVKKLKMDKDARVFTEFNEWYQSIYRSEHSALFEVKVKELIGKALREGMDKNKIEKIVTHILEHQTVGNTSTVREQLEVLGVEFDEKS